MVPRTPRRLSAILARALDLAGVRYTRLLVTFILSWDCWRVFTKRGDLPITGFSTMAAWITRTGAGQTWFGVVFARLAVLVALRRVAGYFEMIAILGMFLMGLSIGQLR